MDSCERVKRALRRQEPDRVPRFDHFWQKAQRDLLREAGVHPEADIADVFDFDCRALGFDQSARFDRKTVREDEDQIVYQDSDGIVIRHFKHRQTTGEHLDFSMKTPEAWKSYRERYAFNPARVNLDRCKELYAYYKKKGKYVFFSALDPFEATWRKCGPEEHLAAYAENPDWVKDMNEAHTRLCEAAWAYFKKEGIVFDGGWFWADIAYKNSTMVSPRAYREILMPYHRRICDMVHADGGELVFHSDGDLHLLIDDLIEAGWDCLQPLEVKAKMDVRELKRSYADRLSFMGNIDARLYADNDLDGLEKEIRDKLAVAKAGGGYVYHSDHSVPPGVTLKTYRQVLAWVDQYGKY